MTSPQQPDKIIYDFKENYDQAN